MPVMTNEGKTIGVTQVLNKIGGPFGVRDEKRLQALGAQAAIALENARLFEDVLNERNYSESILKSLSNGVITLDSSHRIIKVNDAASRFLNMRAAVLENETAESILGPRQWVMDGLARVESTGEQDLTLDADVVLEKGDRVSVNLTIDRLNDVKGQPIGFILILEDITSEKRVKSTMARYMDRDLADRLLEGGDLVGATQQASVLFSDIRDFTGLAERLGARDTVSMLNDYFSEMVDVVQAHRGMLDKYIGDAIMAVFGAPFPSDDNAENAVAAAVQMIARLRVFNRDRTLRNLPSIDIRVGVNTGEVVAGNIGSPKRVDYTVIGDSVNLASRLEGANKFYGTNILISETSLQALGDQNYPVRELDLIRVKGRNKPVAVFEIYEEHEDVSTDALLQAFGAGLASYRERRWQEACDHFRNVLTVRPGDRPSQIFLEHSEYYHCDPPDEAWGGVWTMTEK
jgi:adenylate cyclase